MCAMPIVDQIKSESGVDLTRAVQAFVDPVTGVITLSAGGSVIPDSGPAFTFAGLPSAVGLSGVTVRVTDIGPVPGVLLISDGVRWKPVNGRATLARASATVAAPLGSLSAVGKISIPDSRMAVSGSIVLPANLLAVADGIVTRVKLRHRGTGATWAAQVKLGTLNSSTDNSFVAMTGAATNDQYWLAESEALVATTTSWLSDGYATPNAMSTGAFLDRTANFNVASIMYIGIYVSSVNAADFVDLLSYQFDWVA